MQDFCLCLRALQTRLPRFAALVLFACAAALVPVSAFAQGYSFQNLYTFSTSGTASYNPQGSVAEDAAGDLFGISTSGGANGLGAVWELQNSSGTYTYRTLYSLTTTSGYERALPAVGVFIDKSGNLICTTNWSGGTSNGGTVFELQPAGGGNYNFSLIHYFEFGSDGGYVNGPVVSDASGNLFGTTTNTVFELVNSSGTYTLQTIHTFTGNSGISPEAGVIVDSNGNLYGTTSDYDGKGYFGTVYELANNGGTYAFNVLYTFAGGADGQYPFAPVAMDANGNLFGTTFQGGDTGINAGYGCGTLFELVNSAGSWSKNIIRNFGSGSTYEGCGPYYGVKADSQGDIFGSIQYGSVFEFVNSSGSYTEQILYSFPYGAAAGEPSSEVLLDSHGDVLGLTSGTGSVWEMTPHFSGTTTVLTSSLNPVLSDTSITLTATVTTSPSGGLVFGSVTFYNGSTVLGTATVTGGSASISIDSSVLGLGNSTLTATFTPQNSSAMPASTGTLVQTVTVEPGVATTTGSNTFTGNQTVNGTVIASGFTGNGSGLTNVTAAGLACAGCVTNYQLGINYAGSTSQGGAANNALELGGMPSSSYATTGSNSFSGDQIVNGTVTATGTVNGSTASFTGAVSSADLVAPASGAATASKGYKSGALDTAASVYNSNANAAQNMLFRWQAEPAAGANNTASPAATLNLLYGANGTPAETGLSVNANGTLNFAAGQTFNGGFTGNITEAQVTGLSADLANASTFATNAANTAQTNAENFASSMVSNSQNVAENFATTAAYNAQTTAQTNAQVFTTAAVFNAQNADQAYANNAAASAQSNAITAAENFSSSTFVPLAGGSMTGPLSSPALAMAPAGTATASQGFNSGPIDAAASLYNSNSGQAQNVLFRWQAEPAANANNSANPAATLNLLYSANGTPAETGLSVNFDGTLTFAAGQNFVGNGAGLTNINATTLTGNIAESQVTNLTADLANGVTTAETFATSAANTAQAAAQTFASAAADNAQSGAQTFATNAANAAQTAAQTFPPMHRTMRRGPRRHLPPTR